MLDVLVEVLLELYMELMLLIVPEKNITKKQRLMAKLLAIGSVIVIAVLLIWGVALIVDHDNLWGVAPITAAVVLSLAQIVAGLVLYRKNH